MKNNLISSLIGLLNGITGLIQFITFGIVSFVPVDYKRYIK